jgi:hypothetical protein
MECPIRAGRSAVCPISRLSIQPRVQAAIDTDPASVLARYSRQGLTDQDTRSCYTIDEGLEVARVRNGLWLVAHRARLRRGTPGTSPTPGEPEDDVFSFDNGAHAVSLEEFQAFHRILVESIIPETYFDH